MTHGFRIREQSSARTAITFDPVSFFAPPS
jgi:hypothetical protein